MTVVVSHVLAEHRDQVALTEDQGPVQQLSAESPASCRKTSSSAFSDADERLSRTSQPQSRTKIR
jgi:hypothetical protein